MCSWWGENSFFGCLEELEQTPDGTPYLCPGETCDKSCDDPEIECGSVCGQWCGACGDGQVCRGDNTCGLDACAAGIGQEGCCDGETVTWCEDGASQAITCQNGCGWDAPNGFYDCGEEGAEPTGTFPIDCAAQTPDPAPEASEQVEPVEQAEHVESVEPAPDAGVSDSGTDAAGETISGGDVAGPETSQDSGGSDGAGAGDAATDSATAGDTGADGATDDAGSDAPGAGDAAADSAGDGQG